MIIEQTTLYYQEGTSDKVYQAWIDERSQGSYVVGFAFGRRGNTMQTGTKTAAPVPLSTARRTYEKLVDSKIAKGYQPGEPGSAYRIPNQGMSTERAAERASQYQERVVAMPPVRPTPTTTTAPKPRVEKEQEPQIEAEAEQEDNLGGQDRILPQLLNTCSKEEMEALAKDPNWVFQQKHDGRRMLLKIEKGEATPINRKGLSAGAPEPMLQEAALLAQGRTIVLDGESVGDQFHCFDLLMLGNDLREKSYDERLDGLEDLFANFSGLYLIPIKTARSEREKTRMLSALEAANAEGVVAKNVQSPHRAGRPASGGPQLKRKFVETASVLITAKSVSKRSVAMSLLDANGMATGCGNVTIPPNHEIPEPGTIAEVRYLYAMPESNALYQPVYLGPRTDINREDCTLAQLKYKG
jgi:bifunctional non-homologous end joining protein LigD